tara:strand:- start:1600 stop:1842 length:243 start_codon:yes stop_codon:yes gene_type:complete
MYDEIIKRMQNQIEELKEKVARLEKENNTLRGDLDALDEEMIGGAKMARAVCELQEELQRLFPELYIINKIHAPTKVGMN